MISWSLLVCVGWGSTCIKSFLALHYAHRLSNSELLLWSLGFCSIIRFWIYEIFVSRIEMIPSEVFINMTDLIHLDLSHNQLGECLLTSFSYFFEFTRAIGVLCPAYNLRVNWRCKRWPCTYGIHISQSMDADRLAVWTQNQQLHDQISISVQELWEHKSVFVQAVNGVHNLCVCHYLAVMVLSSHVDLVTACIGWVPVACDVYRWYLKVFILVYAFRVAATAAQKAE